MFAIAFDMVVADIRKHCPKGISSAYTEIAKTVAPFGFERVQGSVYVGRSDDIARLFDAITALKALKDRKSTRLNSSHPQQSRLPSSA